MKFKHRAWIPIAWIGSVVNVVSVFFAARPGEPWHATIHAALGVLFALGAQRLAARRRASGPGALETGETGETGEARESLSDMQTRLGEMEERLDFTERLLAKHRETDRPGSPPR